MIKRVLTASAVLALSAALAQAQEVKIGLVAPFTGIGAELGQQIDRGVEQYLKLKADEFKPYKIKIIKRDERSRQQKPTEEVAAERKSTQEAARDMVATVTQWVNEFQQKRRVETSRAIKTLFTDATPQTSKA